jgi:hypothetical protein
VIGLLIHLGYVLDYHYAISGYWKGQVCYHGLPVDYWRKRVGSYQEWLNNPPAGVNDGLFAHLYYVTGVSLFPKPPMREGDRDSLPMLLILLRDPNSRVREYAAKYLTGIEPLPQEAIDTLIECWNDDPGIGYWVMPSLESCGPAARKALPKIIQELEEWKRYHPSPGPEMAISPGDAAELAKDYDRRIHSEVSARALQSIDPEEARRRGL